MLDTRDPALKAMDRAQFERMRARIAALEAALRHLLESVEGRDRVELGLHLEARSHAHSVLRK